MSRGVIAAAVCLAVVVGVVFVVRSGRNDTSQQHDPNAVPGNGIGSNGVEQAPENGSTPTMPVKVVVECERPTRIVGQTEAGEPTLKIVKAERADLYGGEGYLETPEGWIKTCGLEEQKDKAGALPGKAFYEMDIPRDDVYFLFLHAKWMDDCGNSVWVRFDDGEYTTIADTLGKQSDGRYDWVWHPVREAGAVKPFRLRKGRRVLELAVKEDGPCFDQFLLTTDSSKPVGHAQQ